MPIRTGDNINARLALVRSLRREKTRRSRLVARGVFCQNSRVSFDSARFIESRVAISPLRK